VGLWRDGASGWRPSHGRLWNREATSSPPVADLKVAEGLASVVKRGGELGGIDLLVNNAGVATAADFLNTSMDAELGAVRLNVEAVMTLTHMLLPEMVRCGRGSIINLASDVAFQPFPHVAVYAASKAFVRSFTDALAEEVNRTEVRVLALCPGAVRTELDVFADNEGLLGNLPSLTPEEVVSTALRPLDDRQVTHVVGGLNRILVFAMRLLLR
jgi:uncharacterized protein